MIAIDDPQLPGLADLGLDTLCRITGSRTVSLRRFRYRAGKRAILHLGTDDREGTLWFFEGDKARRLARRNRGAIYDDATAALYEAFPDDHRMPQVRAFLDDYATLAPPLIGGRPQGEPQLLRYRPGLSCTFRCAATGRPPAYVKIVTDDDPVRLAIVNRRVAGLLDGGPLSIAPVIAIDAGISAISYGQAGGRPLDAELAGAGGAGPVLQAIDALRRFWRLAVTPARHLDGPALLLRGAESVSLVGVTVPQRLPEVARIQARLEQRVPGLACRPIHADMKLEHLFIDHGQTTLIDTESISLGPPDYDLAQIYGRLWQAELEGQLPGPLVADTAREVRRAAGDTFDWCLGIVALRLAKFYAQRPDPDSPARIAAILERLE